MKLQDDELQWKLALNYDVENGNFVLFINNKAFLSMLYKSSLAPPVSQNIETGIIMLNGVKVHRGYTQYTAGLLGEWCDKKGI